METIFLQDVMEVLRQRLGRLEDTLVYYESLNPDLFLFVMEDLVRMTGDLRALEVGIVDEQEAGEDERTADAVSEDTESA